MTDEQKITCANNRFAKAGVLCFYESEVLNSSFVDLMKFSAENPFLGKAVKRCAQAIYLIFNEEDIYNSFPLRGILLFKRANVFILRHCQGGFC
jgi:hypothetical protein